MTLADAVRRDFEAMGFSTKGIPRRRKSRVAKRRSTKRWVQKAINPKHKGYLHRALKVPLDKKIPLSKLRRAAKRSGVIGRRARFALIARKFRHRQKRKK